MLKKEVKWLICHLEIVAQIVSIARYGIPIIQKQAAIYILVTKDFILIDLSHQNA